MKNPALSHLVDLIIEEQRRKYPNVPERLLPKPNTFATAKPERKELRRIVTFINSSGGIASITDSSAKRIDNRKTYTDSVGFTRTIGSVTFVKNNDFTRGHSDITATWHGKPLFIELKRIDGKYKDRQSSYQKDFEQNVTEAGATYVIVSSFDTFYEWATNNNLI